MLEIVCAARFCFKILHFRTEKAALAVIEYRFDVNEVSCRGNRMHEANLVDFAFQPGKRSFAVLAQPCLGFLQFCRTRIEVLASGVQSEMAQNCQALAVRANSCFQEPSSRNRRL